MGCCQEIQVIWLSGIHPRLHGLITTQRDRGCEADGAHWLIELTDASIIEPPTSLGLFQCQNAVDTGLKAPKDMLSPSYLNLTLCNEITDEGLKILNADIRPHLPQPVRLQENHGRGAQGAQHADIRPQNVLQLL